MTSPAYSYSCLKECPAGEFSFYGQASCVNVCPVGSYISGDQACTSCPNDFTTASAGSASVAECNICVIGYFLDGSLCTSCGAGETTISSGSTSVDQCMCMASGIATCFASASNGDEIGIAPGTLSSWDGIRSDTQLSLSNKYESFACNTDGGACIWQGVTGKRVVYIYMNGGTTTLTSVIIKDGVAGIHGGGLYVYNSNVILILIDFTDNAATYYGGAIYVYSGSSTATLYGCSFARNTASSGPDVYNDRKTVVINPCPAGHATTQGSALSNYNKSGGTMTTPAYSYTCQACSGGTSSTAGATFCSTCPAGTSSPDGTPCADCEASKFSVEG